MTIYIGADHRGFALKEKIKKFLTDEAYGFEDLGAASLIADDDYPDYAKAVASKIAEAPRERRGILVCGSGFGVDITANRFREVRSALAMSPDHVYVGRHDDDVNVLALAADFTSEADALKIVRTFLMTPFDEKTERYVRRLRKMEEGLAGDE